MARWKCLRGRALDRSCVLRCVLDELNRRGRRPGGNGASESGPAVHGADLPEHALLVRGTRRRPGLADDAGGEGAAAAHQQRAGDPAARRAAVHVLERGPARRQHPGRRHQLRRQPAGCMRPASPPTSPPRCPGTRASSTRRPPRSPTRPAASSTSRCGVPARTTSARRPATTASLTFWAPTVNMDRDPRWGRTDEAFGEDPYLVGQMAGAFVDGYQGETLGRQSHHRLPEGRRDGEALRAQQRREQPRTASQLEHTTTDLRDYYTAQFKSLIENAHVSGRDDVVQRDQRHPVGRRHVHRQRARAAHLRVQRLHAPRDCGAVGTTYLNPAVRATTGRPPGWTHRRRAAQAPCGPTPAPAQQVCGAAGGQAYAVRAGTDLNCTGGEYTLPEHPGRRSTPAS